MFGTSLRCLAQRLATNQITNALRSVSISAPVCSNAKYSTQIQVAQAELNPENRKQVLDVVSQQIAQQGEGRLFAVVHLCGKQFKVTAGDIILVEGYWPPTTGDKIRLDKVLLAGGEDFSLIGRPLLQKGLVDVQATIIEKTLTHTKTHFRKKRRKQYVRFNFYRSPNTMLMINSIDITGSVNQEPAKSVDDVRIF